MGYDSNVSGGVNNSNINLPIYGNVAVSPSGVKAGSRFGWLAAGGQISRPIAPGVAVFAGGQADGKFNNTNNQFDQQNIAVSGGLTYLQNKNFYRVTASHSEVAVDDTRFRDVNSIAGEWHHQLDELQTISPFVQYAQLRYTGNNISAGTPTSMRWQWVTAKHSSATGSRCSPRASMAGRNTTSAGGRTWDAICMAAALHWPSRPLRNGEYPSVARTRTAVIRDRMPCC